MFRAGVSSEEDMLARAMANGDQNAMTAALTSGTVRVKQRKEGPSPMEVHHWAREQEEDPMARSEIFGTAQRRRP